MSQSILMPKLGNTVESVIIVAWHKGIGDSVAMGDVLCEVETDKASVEVEAEQEGILLAQLHEPGDEVPVLAPFAVLGKSGETVPEQPEPIADKGSADAQPSLVPPRVCSDSNSTCRGAGKNSCWRFSPCAQVGGFLETARTPPRRNRSRGATY